MNYDEYKITDLQILCQQRGLSTSYRVKADLVNRLRTENIVDEVFDNTNSSENGDNNSDNNSNSNSGDNSDNSGNGDSNTNDEDNSSGNLSGNEEDHNDRDNQEENSNDDPDKNPIVNEEQESDEEEVIMASISFKDVEEALEKFNGHSHENVLQWIESFEDAAITCKWSEPHKYIFARRLMRDEAKGCIFSPKTKNKVKDYDTLIAFLKEEYKDDASHIEIHTKLVNRKKRNDESTVAYMYEIIKMANERYDDKSLVRYVVDGLPDDGRNKSTLLEATTIDELKKKLKIYELAKVTPPKKTRREIEWKRQKRTEPNKR